MLKAIIKLALNIFTLLIVAYLVPGFRFVDFWAVVVAAVVIGVVNTFIRPILQIIFIPLTIVTLGITAFLINVVLLWGVSFVVSGFSIDSFMTAVIASIVLALVSMFLNKLSENKDDN
ncbi:hypothetical protein A2115_00125 [Candidatus Woesebacteria bacterium GWA1_41_8]|uniref:Phage holin family protein n=1 Tax=Candidatus Woesebacteria bacterium GWA1_41_8 TaxID=1802471 RepID=A0A1F7WJ76_9BACT|nr:MAG: hypothetical protein A2115_00125 [Candidatus Woesebacteria bacterium GWA1_41_8]